MTDRDDDMLENLFAEARNTGAPVSDDLMARVLADAAVANTPPPSTQGVWDRFLDMIGGWPAVSGLAAATVAGIWVGVAPPASVDALTASLVGETVTLSVFSDVDVMDTGFFVDG